MVLPVFDFTLIDMLVEEHYVYVGLSSDISGFVCCKKILYDLTS